MKKQENVNTNMSAKDLSYIVERSELISQSERTETIEPTFKEKRAKIFQMIKYFKHRFKKL